MNNEIKAGSKILAEFEGYTWSKFGSNLPDDGPLHRSACYELGDDCKFLRQFTYHTDYNELMRVWRKFRDLDDLEYRFKPKYKFKKAWLKILIAENPIEDVFKELVEGVKYLNSIKPKS